MKPKWFQEIESLYFWNLWCFHGKFWSFWWFFFFVTWFEAPKPVVFDQNSSWAGFQIVPITLFCFIPQKRFLKEPLRGIPFVWVLSFLCLNVVENLYRPKDQTLSFIVRVVVVVVGGWNRFFFSRENQNIFRKNFRRVSDLRPWNFISFREKT